MLRVEPFDHALDDLPGFIEGAIFGRASLRGFVPTSEEDELEIIGPFPSYCANPRAIAAGDWGEVAPSGWRALARRGGRPVGLIGIVEVDGRPSYSLRDADAADAFADVLKMATGLETRAETYDVRWLILPAIYLTALWLKGENDLFIPTRLGTAGRVVPDLYSRGRIEQLSAELVETASTYADRSATDRPAPQSRRSGL